ncbi:olfactory receptor 7A17-like [Sorex araneus]|uniref:olfactory receptor 7A17-like n=1 Tax=Sorex araneus TaxID=42254 RepID=UPI002433496C|nr:olfactory receptor 7A17-like [Sorex araneus]
MLDGFCLTVMPSDHSVAICHPLRHTAILNHWLCRLMVLDLGSQDGPSFIINLLSRNSHLHLEACSSFSFHHMLRFGLTDMHVYSVAVKIDKGNAEAAWFTLYDGRHHQHNHMKPDNDGNVSEFILLGFSEDPELQPLIFGLFLSMYLITVLGNLLIILADGPSFIRNLLRRNSHLHLETCSSFSFHHMLRFGLTDMHFYSVAVKDARGNAEAAWFTLYDGRHHQYNHMKPDNEGNVSKFILLGFSEDPELQPLIFGLFLSMYLVTLLGNLLIILAVSFDPHLHTPMYFFLSNLSLVDICFTSTTVPQMLLSIHRESNATTYEGCIAQQFFTSVFASLDDFLLTVMAYDRFVAICHPLHYTVIMNPRFCGLLVLGSWIMSSLICFLQSILVLRLSFCTDLEIPNFFCELKLIVQVACSDPFVNNVVMYITTALMGAGPMAGIIYSYSKIVSSICRIASAQGKMKAFSTCASHLSVVSLFYCSCLGVYLSSAATHSSQSSSAASAMYSVVTPMLNPFIYSLRNRDIKRALNAFLVKGTTKGHLS